MMRHLSVPQKTILLLITAVLFLGAGWGMGKILTAKRATPSAQISEGEESGSEKDVGEAEGELPSDWESYSGTIVLSDSLIYMEGSHQLVDESGELIVLLKARDDKLEFASGMEATVQGPVGKTTEDDQRIMTVEKIVFR